jgi:pimeloyl-ACP methyl ester carboxylesterase
VHSAGARLRVLRWGDPTLAPVLLLHGLTSNARRWEAFAETAAGRFHLIAPDARGHGDSSAPPSGYDPHTMTRDLLAVLDTLGVERAAVMGHSMGGRLGIQLAVEAPERVSRLVVVDMGVGLNREGTERIRESVLRAPQRFESREAAARYIRGARPLYPQRELERRLRHNLRPTPDGGLEWRHDRRAIEEIYRLAREADLAELAGSVRCPALLIWGEASDVLPREGAERTAALLRAELETMPGAGHSLISDRPEEFGTIALRFLAPWAREGAK